jgi:hypothetical protein
MVPSQALSGRSDGANRGPTGLAASTLTANTPRTPLRTAAGQPKGALTAVTLPLT